MKREDDRSDGGPQERYESYSYGGVDPYMWEPQELGKLSSMVDKIENFYRKICWVTIVSFCDVKLSSINW